MERFKPPIAVIIVGRPNSEVWNVITESGKVQWNFSEDLFRCLSHEIGNPNASNPAIQVYFSIGDFASSGDTSPPPIIDVALAQRTIVFVLLDSGFRRSPDRWADFFKRMRANVKLDDDLRFIPMARSDDGQLRKDIKRLGLGNRAPLYGHSGEPLRLMDLVANNKEAALLGRQTRDLVMHPDPPLREHELERLKRFFPDFEFLTPSTVLISTIETK
jgi:hypothetical protein